MYDIYYAHHQWKYGTQVENYELDLIRRYFPLGRIFNPSTDLKATSADGESTIMEECLETIRNSDILVFSSMDGVVGTGVYHEVEEAEKLGKIIFYIFHDELYTDFTVVKRSGSGKNDRLYGLVSLNA